MDYYYSAIRIHFLCKPRSHIHFLSPVKILIIFTLDNSVIQKYVDVAQIIMSLNLN